MIRIGSLFSGIGGLELGLEWALTEAGIHARTIWQVEREPFPRAVLARHWPEADRSVEDVCVAGFPNLAPVDIICGGFPCQDLSVAGKGAGLAGERSGLWREYARVVRELRPRVVVVENVSALLARGLHAVLGDLAALGYDARWRCVRASDVGAPHRRERLFVVAYPRRGGVQRRGGPGEMGGPAGACCCDRDQRERDGDAAWDGGEAVAHGFGDGPQGIDGAAEARATGGGCQVLADAHSLGQQRQRLCGLCSDLDARSWNDADGRGCAADMGHADGERERQPNDAGETERDRREGSRPNARRADGRLSEPRVGGASHGLSAGMDRWPAGPAEAQHAWEAPRTAKGVAKRVARLKALGNAVVPQVAREVGRWMISLGLFDQTEAA